MWSYWEWKSFKHYDLIVIGAGIVGLSTAIQYKEKYPSKKVLVLERGVLPTGASTKNAGFACFGSLTEILDDLEHMKESEVLALINRRYKGLQSIREKFGDEALGYKDTGGFELITDNELHFLGHMQKINKLLFPIFKTDVFSEVEEFDKFGFGTSVKAVIRNKFEGELDSGKFISTLWQYTQQLGVTICTGAEVISLDDVRLTVKVKNDTHGHLVFDGSQIAICTNAFTKHLFPDLDIKPGRGLVFVTQPLSTPLPWEGSFHYNKGYVYFRSIDGRLLLGGGRDQDFEREESLEFKVNPKVKSYLLQIVEEIILPDQKLEIAMEWTGIMAFGESKKPIVRQLCDHVYCAVRLGGMGVAIGWQTASELVEHF